MNITNADSKPRGVLLMNGELAHQTTSSGKRKSAGRMDYWLIFSACFAVFLPVAVAARCLPRAWRRSVVGRHATSIYSEARGMAHECATLAFSG